MKKTKRDSEIKMTSTVMVVHTSVVRRKDISAVLAKAGIKEVHATISDVATQLCGHAVDAVVLIAERSSEAMAKEILTVIKGIDDHLPLMVVAKSKSVEEAVAIMKAGAYDFFPLPLDHLRFQHALMKAIELYTLTKRVFLLENQMGWHGSCAGIVGASPKMEEIFRMIQTVAKTNTTVLIQGESGTGKELVAKAIHTFSPKAKKVFVDINCGAIPRELLENELFGHERGSYTGADRRYQGSVERAHGGSLFLDEISEMDQALQVKLLRFLQERSFSRIGGSESIAVDVRIIAATNRNLADEVAKGRFREDLYFRLNVIPIFLPPLRERREDIPLLARFFLDKYTAKSEKIFVDFASDALAALMAFDWPGNVRELENVIERAVVLHNDSRVKLAHLPEQLQKHRSKGSAAVSSALAADGGKILPLDLVERYAIELAMKECLGNIGDAADKLKVSSATLYRKLKGYGLRE
ncbi:MAG: sigma-54-dependent Fis family transcriptional regulator [Deltaproteobacteria bacterium]|nr:sigma-54-dependent Fis family transcriptional regulator [Deltaproteobacteria bacterium]